MSNYCTLVISGNVTLAKGVRTSDIQSLFEGSQGDWSIRKGVLQYSFWNEGNYTLRGPDHHAMIESLIERGYNSAGWRQQHAGDSENGGSYSASVLRGTPEQQRKLRLEEIPLEISALARERQALIGACG